VEETRQREYEKEVGRQRLRSLNLDEENIIKYTLRKHIVDSAQDEIQWQYIRRESSRKTERQWTPKQEDFSRQSER
jgi:hypothetical protein